MPELNILQAVNLALVEEMRRDDRVVVLGEDVGTLGGVFRATEGLLDEFGEDRVLDTPLAEGGIIGTAVGMALYGLKPVPEIQFVDFIYPGYDQIVSEIAKYRYRSGGQYPCPVVIRSPYGGGIRGGHYHSQSPEVYFTHTPGLVVVIPSNPYDTAGLLRSAIRSEDPVIFLEPKRIYRTVKGEVPEEDFTVPLGVARQVREGADVSVIAYGSMLHQAMEATELAAGKGIECDLLDLRTLLPLDVDAVLASVVKTGRAIIVQEAPKFCGYAAEIAAILAEKAILHLEAPVLRVGGFDTPFPYALEQIYLPDAARILAAIEQVANF
ncbi:MAG: alpha-ketoacid dehydrogenase subunit beta [Acidobacteriota bacterium]